MTRKRRRVRKEDLLLAQAHSWQEELAQHDALRDVGVGVEGVAVQGAGQAGLADALAADDAGLEEGRVDLQGGKGLLRREEGEGERRERGKEYQARRCNRNSKLWGREKGEDEA